MAIKINFLRNWSWPVAHPQTMNIANPPLPPFSLRPRAVSDPEGKGGMGGFGSYFLSNQSGAVLVIALIMMVIFTMIGLAASFTSIFEILLSGHKRGSTNAFYSADSGVQVVLANTDNFDLTEKYVSNQYDPFTDPSNKNPTNAKALITFETTQSGPPRGSGFSATGNYEFRHFLVESTGQDQIELNPNKSTCTIEQKVVRLVPTLQGGN